MKVSDTSYPPPDQGGFDPRTEQKLGDHLPGSSPHQCQAGQKDLNHDNSSRSCRGWIVNLKVTLEMLSTVAGTQNKLTVLSTCRMRDWAAEGSVSPALFLDPSLRTSQCPLWDSTSSFLMSCDNHMRLAGTLNAL